MLVLPLARSMQTSSDRLKLWSAEKGLRFGQPNFEHAGFTVTDVDSWSGQATIPARWWSDKERGHVEIWSLFDLMKSLPLWSLVRTKYTATAFDLVDVTLPGHSDEVKVPCQHALQSSNVKR